MAGLVFREVRRSFKQGVVCGYVSKSDHSLHLNPGEQQKLEWGDRLIVLANDGELETPRCWPSWCFHQCMFNVIFTTLYDSQLYWCRHCSFVCGNACQKNTHIPASHIQVEGYVCLKIMMIDVQGCRPGRVAFLGGALK